MIYEKDATGYTLNYQGQKSTFYMIWWKIDKTASGDVSWIHSTIRDKK